MLKLKYFIYKKWGERRNREILGLLEHNPKAKLVDLGCGDGGFTIEVARTIGTRNVYCIDIYDPNIEKARNKSITVIKHDLNEAPYPFKDNEFDVVLSNQVIEHLFYPVKFMKEVYRILKPRGYAVISTENLASWDNILALILGYTPFSMEFDEGLRKIGNPLSPHNKEQTDPAYPPHVRILTYKGLIELAEYVGFKLEKVAGSGHIFGKLGEITDKRHARFITIKIRK